MVIQPDTTSDGYVETRVLSLGSTYPSYDKHVIETTCTGCLLPDGRLARLHPVPRRYLARENQFKKFQWLDVKLKKNTKDPRPESFRIDPTTIRPGDVIGTNAAGHRLRRSLLVQSPHLCQSIEQLHDRQRSDEKLSLGIVRPRQVVGRRVVCKTDEERRDWEQKGKTRLAQVEMFPDDLLLPLDFPEVDIYVSVLCDDVRCTKPHEMKLLDWGVHELWRKYRHEPNGVDAVLEAVDRELDVGTKDVFLFLGTLHNIQWNFCLMGSYAFPRKHADQPALFA